MIKYKYHSQYLPLIVTGYALFSLLVIGVFASTTIPMGIMLLNPNVMHYNVAVFAISLTIGATLPLLLGYLVGDHAIRSKERVRHHVNGVLFGLLAFWIMTLSTLFIALPSDLFNENLTTRILVMNIIPSVIVSLMTAALAITHARSRQAKQDIIDYKPYSFMLIGSLILLQLGSLVVSLAADGASLYALILPTITAALSVAAYASIRNKKLTTYHKVTWSAIILTVGFVAVSVSTQLVHAIANYVLPMPTMEAQAISSGLAVFMALAGWIVYWVCQIKVLNGK